MQYEAESPEDYLDQIDNDWRKDKLQEIREMITSNAPDLKESIGYKMLCYGNSKEKIFYLNVQQAYVSLYLGDIEKIPNFQTLLKGFHTGKGCIRVKKNNNLAETKLNEFIHEVIRIWRNGGDMSC